MVLEVAILDVKSGREQEFEAAFGEAQKIISSMDGYVSHQLQKCIEKGNRYILLVNWQTIAPRLSRTISDCLRRGRSRPLAYYIRLPSTCAGRACGA